MKEKIYLLPGVMCDNRLWSYITPLLEDKYELIHINIPLKSSLDEIVETLKEIFPPEKINLLGFSLGGYIASYFASKNAHRIKKLMVIGASPCSLPSTEIEKRQSVLHMFDNFGFKALSEKKILSLMDKKYHYNEVIIKLIGDMYKDLGIDVYKSQIQSTLYREDLLNCLCKLDITMTFIYSLRDRLVNQEWMNQFKQCKKASMVELDLASHMLPLEEPKLISTQIVNWMNN